MNTLSQEAVQPFRFPARSFGVKLLVVGALALSMTIPALFVSQLVEDRSKRSAEVSHSVGSVSGGHQIFLGPVLAIPYTSSEEGRSQRVDKGVYVIFPARGEADLSTHSEVRHRSLFPVNLYSATVSFKASFDLANAGINLPLNTSLDWTRAELITGASDSRGALADATVIWAGTKQTMGISALLNRLPLEIPDHPETGLKMFGMRPGSAAGPGAKFEIAATMQFSGSEKLTVLPFGKTTDVTVRGDWPNPSFTGGFLPVSQSVGQTGFQAHWSIPSIARGVRAEGPCELIASLLPLGPAVSFVSLANPYQSVARSLKYALLFLCLVFGAFFTFEATTGKRVHPAQYVLVGVAQLVFYLLLLSIAERIGFGPAFAIAAASTVSLISMDANWIFESRRQGARAFVFFSLVYGLIYVLLTLEDEALLIGSIVSFFAIAAIMYLTRSLDWYREDAAKVVVGT